MSVDQQEHLSDIIAASLLDDLDGKGKQELNEWLNESHLHRNFYDALQHSFSSGEASTELSGYDSVRDWVLVRRKVMKSRRRKLYKRGALYAAAATGALVLITTLLIPFTERENRNAGLAEAGDMVIKENYKALLVLSTGDMLDLGQELVLDDGKIKNDGTVLEYNSQPSEAAVEEQPKMHTLKVPRGAEYKVVLADGTAVHLNADSELRYPERFGDGNRTVELTGEAYFEVAHNPESPFIVKGNDMILEVLGTEFNFRCYHGESRSATLVNGLLKVHKGEESLELDPGSQVYEDGDSTLQLRKVDPADYTGWRNKRFVYEGCQLDCVMQDIARWYDMDIRFHDEQIMKLKLTANIPRYENIESVLKIIRQAVYANIETDGKKITVSQDKG